MLKRASLAVLAVAMAGAAYGQEPSEEGENRAEPVRKIQVLQNPYDIASFYRSSSGGNYFGYQAPSPEYRGPYSLASFYRSQQSESYAAPAYGPYGYGRFWTSGYGRGTAVLAFRRRIGQNGDLFLLTPTFLAPIGPLAGAFFEGR